LGILHMASEILFALMLRLALVLLILGLIDYFYQRHKVEKQLRMSKQEIKDELKRMEGDPLVKHRRRQVQAKLAMQRIAIDVPRSDVVVTNPTEYAVALKYDEATMHAPRVLAKGKDLLALRIRQIAQQYGIILVQRPPLARGLYTACDVGDEIPPAYYRAVAEVLAYVYQLSGRAAG
jgi:flagellar biosynthetic protein FlhB